MRKTRIVLMTRLGAALLLAVSGTVDCSGPFSMKLLG
jgi:hypothetical protein